MHADKIGDTCQYNGETKNGVPHGQGVCNYFNYPIPAVYNGTWKNGEANGYGELEWTNGFWYKGKWKDGAWFGKGTKKFDNQIYNLVPVR